MMNRRGARWLAGAGDIGAIEVAIHFGPLLGQIGSSTLHSRTACAIAWLRPHQTD